jgi:hypothetical protein
MSQVERNQIEARLIQLIEQLKGAAGAKLESVILYGSAASAEFHDKFSDVNVACFLQDLSASTMVALFQPIEWWTKQKQPAPLLLSVEELERSADVFAIELLDMQKHHRVLYGKDVITGLQVPLRLHRIQVEHELRTKLILLRQAFVTRSRHKDKVTRLMLESVSSFTTLFRHSLIAMGEQPETGKRAMLQQLERKLQVDIRPFIELLGVREGRLKLGALDAHAIFPTYLKSIEQVISAVDQL